MKYAIALVAAAIALAGCSHAPAVGTPNTAAAIAAQAKANPFLGLTKLEAGEGGDVTKKKAKRHFSAKTTMGGFLRLEDMGEVVLAHYNYDEISVPKKIAQIAEALDQAATTADPELAKAAQEFRAKLLAPNPFLGLTDVKFVAGPPPNAPFWHLATRHIQASTRDGGNLCIVEQRDVTYEFGIVRNGENVNDGRSSNFAVEAFLQALPAIKDAEVAKVITEHFGK
ncbi:MAG: hypothetical protein JWM80_3001 [Cyanobacteria bacterium RYN_339]|nr:hypothetical protein [Cyanobacteria bacterium RYN_339]